MVSQSFLSNRPSLKALNTCWFAFISQFQYNKQETGFLSIAPIVCGWLLNWLDIFVLETNDPIKKI